MASVSRVFRPRLVPTLVTLVLLPVLVSLGFWQLDRAEQKRQLLAEQQIQEQLPPVVLGRGVPKDLSPFRKIRVSGRFDVRHSFLLDNKTHLGQVGYQVLTPLLLGDGSMAILVNRGWIPMGASRMEVPRIETPDARLTITGRMIESDKAPLQLSEDNIAGGDWPIVIQWTDFGQLEQRLGYSLLEYILLQDPDNPAGFVRDWSIAWIKPEKSTSYAVQWFTLAAALLVIYVVVNLRRVEKSGE
ncbi:MAG TPA: SURF1 family protein [Chromatiales bacterium]|nr:SURF1 family protein [Chromatiales bacterium]